MEIPAENSFEENKQEKPLCLNCSEKMPRKAKFCPNCGQRNNKGIVSMSELLQRFWNNLTHLDGKLLRMMWHLLFPGKVTIAYFRGQQKRYPNPVQFFLVIMFFFLFTLNYWNKNYRKEPIFKLTATSSKKETYTTTDTVLINSVKKLNSGGFLATLQRYGFSQEICAIYDSLPANMRTPEAAVLLDSLLTRTNGERATAFRALIEAGKKIDLDEESTDSLGNMQSKLPVKDSLLPQKPLARWNGRDSIPVGLAYKSFNFAVVDLAKYTPEQLVERYQITNVFERVLVRQGLKTLHSPETLMKFYLGSLSWTVLAIITFMAFVLYLMYAAQKRYYVEHFVFLLHQNTAAFLLITIYLLLSCLFGSSPFVALLLIGWIDIALLLAMYRFYNESKGKTVLKWLTYNVAWLISFVLFFLMGLFVSLALF